MVATASRRYATLSRQSKPPSQKITGSVGSHRPMSVQQVSGNPLSKMTASAISSVAIMGQGRKQRPDQERREIAKAWQVECYRQVNICGEARYAATLFSNIAARAEIGVSEPQALATKAVWKTSGPEVEAFNELAPTVRERTKLIRDYMLHRTIAGECYLIARSKVATDPGYIAPPVVAGVPPFVSWEKYQEYLLENAATLDPDFDTADSIDPNDDVWEIVAVTEIRRVGDDTWEVRHDNDTWLKLKPHDPVIRMWNPDPEKRREAWSPFKSLMPTLREIEWLTAHIFRQVRSRLMSGGVWFLPENMTFPPPPVDAVEGGAEAIARMNEAERFMVALAASGMQELDEEEVAFPSIVMADAAALESIDQKKLIQFWSDIDDKAMTMRSSAVRRFALGMDLPPEQVLGASGLAVDGSGGSAGSVNHWGVWANEEQTISAHVEPALDDFTGVLTWAFLRLAVPNTLLVIAYDTATLRLKQDRSKQSMELYDRGAIKAEVMVRENGFDPGNDMMDDKEFKKWLLVKMFGNGSATPDQLADILRLLTGYLVSDGTDASPGKGAPGPGQPRNLDGHPQQGKPQVQHDQSEAPYSALLAASEVLVLRALEKAGNRLVNDRKRGKDRDRSTPLVAVHVGMALDHTYIPAEFDFTLAETAFSDVPAKEVALLREKMGRFCADLYNEGAEYSREALLEALE